MDNKAYYISLTRGLNGYYVKVLATSEEVARAYANNYFSHNWCSIYQLDDLKRFKERGWKTEVINEDAPVILNDYPEYE